MNNRLIQVVTVTMNPAIDQTLTIPDFRAGTVNRVERQHSKPGGKGVNVASALADYGLRVAVTGLLGRENGAPFEALFTEKGIDDHFVRIAGRTRVGIKISDPARQQTTDINFLGLRPAPADVGLLLQRLEALAGQSRPWVVLAGSLPPGVELTTYRDLVGALKKEGCRCLLDTSGEALAHALDAGPHIIKPNIHELEEVVGRQLSTNREVVEAARALLAKGVECAAVSMGSEGALFVTREEVILAGAPNVKVRSTVGAGDAMVAGILAGQLDGLSLAHTARLATAFSLDLLTRDESASTSRAAIDAFMPEITIRDFGADLR